MVTRTACADFCRGIVCLFVVCACLGPAILHADGPARIVSTSPSITETLFALGLGRRVVGVSTFCRYPPEVATLAKVGTFLRPDAEVIARLRPDLVAGQSSQDKLAGSAPLQGRIFSFSIPDERHWSGALPAEINAP